MSLEETLRRVAKLVRSGDLQNEEQTKLAAILPILRALDWDETNPSEFIPEYHVDNGRVDYALFDPGQTPLVFVEAKKHGHASEQGEDQLFKYASNKGVPFLILTDGDSWNFYLSMAAGAPVDRKFFQLLIRRCDENDKDDKTNEYVDFFIKYLKKERVISEDARQDAERLRTDISQKTRARKAIPAIWQILLESPNEDLCGLVADAVENEKGIRPGLDDVEEFLKKSLHTNVGNPIPDIRPLPNGKEKQDLHPSRLGDTATNPNPGRIVGYVLAGKTIRTRNGNHTLSEILKEFQRRDSTFMDRFSARTMGGTRRLVAKSREGLYDKSHLMEYSINLENGWYLGTNISTLQVKRYIGIACQISGVSVELCWSSGDITSV